MKYLLGTTAEGKQCCPHCKQEKIKLVYGAKIVDKKGAVKWAFRCSSCYGTIWSKAKGSRFNAE